MTVSDFFDETRERFQNQSAKEAGRETVHQAYLGGLRRLQPLIDTEPHWERDWDILVILDSCRVDLFKSVCHEYDWLPRSEEVDSLWSVGSSSNEWLAGMFAPVHHDDMRGTAYITGNMFYQHVNTEPLTQLSVVEPEWMEEYGIKTAPQDPLTDRAIKTWREKEVDRMIIHYMQPHTPFRSNPEWFDHQSPNRVSWGEGFTRLRDGEIDPDDFWRAYQENLRWVLDDAVDVLRKNTDGTIALSADHGNGLGEFGVYGHPFGMPTPSVRKVPFVTIEGTDEGTHVPDVELTDESERPSAEQVQEHLQHLGYKE